MSEPTDTPAEPVDRYAVEREARKAKIELDRYASTDGRSGSPRPTSRAREAAIQVTRSRTATPETQRPAPAAAQPAPAGGDTIDFYVYKDGVLGTLKLQTGGAFEPLP